MSKYHFSHNITSHAIERNATVQFFAMQKISKGGKGKAKLWWLKVAFARVPPSLFILPITVDNPCHIHIYLYWSATDVTTLHKTQDHTTQCTREKINGSTIQWNAVDCHHDGRAMGHFDFYPRCPPSICHTRGFPQNICWKYFWKIFYSRNIELEIFATKCATRLNSQICSNRSCLGNLKCFQWNHKECNWVNLTNVYFSTFEKGKRSP